jgi:hypothetical protein
MYDSWDCIKLQPHWVMEVKKDWVREREREKERKREREREGGGWVNKYRWPAGKGELRT